MFIKLARWRMARALARDRDLYRAYRANIAMLIYDDQMAGVEGRSNSPPTNLATVGGCNSMAERLIDLIFPQ